MGSIISIIIGVGYTIGPISMGWLLSYVTIEMGWIVTGIVAGITSVLMFLLEKYEVRQEKTRQLDLLLTRSMK